MWTHARHASATIERTLRTGRDGETVSMSLTTAPRRRFPVPRQASSLMVRSTRAQRGLPSWRGGGGHAGGPDGGLIAS